MKILDNPRRGCGHLKEHGMYLRGGMMDEGGTIPGFVEFKQPILFLGKFFKGYSPVNGLQFEMANPELAEVVFPEGYEEGMITNLAGATIPSGQPIETELRRYLYRMVMAGREPEGAPFDSMRTPWATDILMFVGETYYKKPQDFIEEALRFGLSKRIGSGGAPPKVIPGITKIYLAHKKAVRNLTDKVDDDGMRVVEYLPGIIGYSYLQEVVFTAKPGVPEPAHITKLAKTGALEIVELGPERDLCKECGDALEVDGCCHGCGDVPDDDGSMPVFPGDIDDIEPADGHDDEPDDPEKPLDNLVGVGLTEKGARKIVREALKKNDARKKAHAEGPPVPVEESCGICGSPLELDGACSTPSLHIPAGPVYPDDELNFGITVEEAGKAAEAMVDATVAGLEKVAEKKAAEAAPAKMDRSSIEFKGEAQRLIVTGDREGFVKFQTDNRPDGYEPPTLLDCWIKNAGLFFDKERGKHLEETRLNAQASRRKADRAAADKAALKDDYDVDPEDQVALGVMKERLTK